MRRALGTAALMLCLATTAKAFSLNSATFSGIKPYPAFTASDSSSVGNIGFGGTILQHNTPFCTQSTVVGGFGAPTIVCPVGKALQRYNPKQLRAKKVSILFPTTATTISYTIDLYISEDGRVFQKTITASFFTSGGPLEVRAEIVAVGISTTAPTTNQAVINFY